MVLPIIILVAIPIFLGIVTVPTFDMPEPEPEEPPMMEKPDITILYWILIGFWLFILIRMIAQIKRGTFRITQKY